MTLNLSHLGIKHTTKKSEQAITEAILLNRVSSKEQAEGYSLEAQEERLRNYCATKDLEVAQVCSFAESSTRGNRPKFRDMMKQIRARRKPIAIVCDKVDRLQRGFKETPMIEELRVTGKAELHFLSDNLILHKNSSSQDLMRYNFMVMMAQNYTDCISENVKRSHEQMVREGKAMGLAPLGYLNVRDPQTKVANIILDEDRCHKIRRIFEYYSTGLYSLSELVQLTKEWGLNNKKKPHKPLCKAQIEKILKNVFYCGYAKRIDEYYEHCYPVIVSMELFMKCVAVRQSRNKQFTKMTKHETVFKGLIKCANCGCAVTPDPKKGGRYIYLKPNSKKGCNCKQINENVANDMVSRVFKSMSMSEEALQPYVEALRTRFKESDDLQAKEKLAYTKQLTVLKTRLDRLKKVYLDGDFTREEYLTEKQSIEMEEETLEKRIESLSTDSKDVVITLEYLLDLVSRVNSLYESSRIDKKRRILKLVFSNFFLNGSKLSYELKRPFDMFVKRSNRLLNWA